MLQNKYSKDQIYLRLIQKEKKDHLAKQSNKIIKKLGDDSKETIKQSRKKIGNINQTFRVSPSISPKLFNIHTNFLQELAYSPSKDLKVLLPISSRAHHHEKLNTINRSNELPTEKSRTRLKKVFKIKHIDPENRAKSSIDFKQKEILESFDHELKAIEARELSLKKNIRNLSIKQKLLKDFRSLSKSPLNRRAINKENRKGNLTERFRNENNVRVFESLEKVNKLLTDFLNTPAIKTHFKAH